MSDALLRAALGAAIPLWVAELRKRPWSEIQAVVYECADIVTAKGDAILYRSKKKGETAVTFNALAKGLAALSFAPGGVTFLGDHYQNQYGESSSPSSGS